MASKLLNTLQNIENDRQAAIMTANGLGYHLSPNASFADIAATAGTRDTVIGLQYPALNEEDWERPKEWPDCYNILREATIRRDSTINKDVEPIGIYLLKDGEDTITFWRKQSAPSSNMADQEYVYADAFLLSDGTWIEGLSKLSSGATIQHNWDITQDVVVNDGQYPGKYRWLIEYRVVDNSTSLSYIGAIRFWPVVEVLSLKTMPGIGRGVYAQSLLNFEMLPESPLRTVRHDQFTYPLFSGFINLRNLKLAPLTHLTIRWAFRDLHRLRKLDLSNFNQITYAYDDEISLYNALSLIEFIGPQSIAITNNTTATKKRVSFKQLPVIQKMILPENTYLDCESNSVLNSSCEIQGCVGFIDSYPRNYEQSGLVGARKDIIPNGNYDYYNFLNIVDFSEHECTSNNAHSVFGSGSSVLKPGACYAKAFIIPQNCYYRLNTSSMYYLPKENIIDIFNRLMDLTQAELAVNTPSIVLSTYQYNLLTPEEIAIATNKGWEVSNV